jgi:hypothetical protein
MARWLKRVKTRLGYYEARTRVRRSWFRWWLRPSDTFMVGHPKSGNTWLAYMLAILLFRDRDHRVTLENVGDYVPFIHAKDHRIGRCRRLPDPRVFRNEIPRYPELYPRVIYLVREPRAALVSFWHMYRVMYGDDRMSLESFVDQYLATDGIFRTWNHGMPRWDRQVTDWFGQAAKGSRVLTLRYEDMVADRRACLHQLARFLGIDRDDAEFALAASRGEFDAMRQVEDRHGAEAYKGKARGEGKFVRVGEIEGWRREMAPSLAARIAAEFAPAMALAGYTESAVAVDRAERPAR